MPGAMEVDDAALLDLWDLDSDEGSEPAQGAQGGPPRPANTKGKSKSSKAEDQPASNKNTAGGRHKGANGKGKRFCRGCQTNLPVDQFALNQTLHFACKKARDCVYKIAKRQNMIGWFQEVEQDEDRFVLLLKRYKDRMPEAEGGGRKANTKFNLAALKETWEASTGVFKDDVGEMMCAEEFMEFSRTCKGGKLTMIQAKLKWDSMKADKKNWMHDMKGPEDAPLRFRVSIKDLVIFRNSFTHDESVDVPKMLERKPDETKINKRKNDILIEHRSDEALDVVDVARTMVASGAGCNEEGLNGAFDGLHVGDLKALIDESSSDEAEPAVQEQDTKGKNKDKDIKAKSKSSKDGCGQSESGLSKTSLVDRDNAISKAQRGWLQGISKLCNEYETEMQSAKDLLLDTASEALNPHFKKACVL